MESASGISPLDGAREELLREASIEAETSGREKAREESGPARSLLVFFLGAEGFAASILRTSARCCGHPGSPASVALRPRFSGS